MAVITNEVSWSRKRKVALEGCPRRYFYQVYLKWDGWLDDAPPERRLAYRLSHMTNLPRMAGIAAHETIRRMITQAGAGRTLNGPAEELAAAIMKRTWLDARDERWRERPKLHPPVFELYYQDGVPRDELVRFGQVARKAVKAFQSSALFARIARSDPGSWLAVDDPLGSDASATVVDEKTKVWARPDFAMRDGARVLLYDWKTGVPKDDDRLQLLSYALHARHTWGTSPTHIVCVAAYLGDGVDEIAHPVTEDALDAVLASIRKDLARMRDLDARSHDETQFPVDPKPGVCAWCEFQEICPAVLRAPQHQLRNAAIGGERTESSP